MPLDMCSHIWTSSDRHFLSLHPLNPSLLLSRSTATQRSQAQEHALQLKITRLEREIQFLCQDLQREVALKRREAYLSKPWSHCALYKLPDMHCRTIRALRHAVRELNKQVTQLKREKRRLLSGAGEREEKKGRGGGGGRRAREEEEEQEQKREFGGDNMRWRDMQEEREAKESVGGIRGNRRRTGDDGRRREGRRENDRKTGGEGKGASGERERREADERGGRTREEAQDRGGGGENRRGSPFRLIPRRAADSALPDLFPPPSPSPRSPKLFDNIPQPHRGAQREEDREEGEREERREQERQGAEEEEAEAEKEVRESRRQQNERGREQRRTDAEEESASVQVKERQRQQQQFQQFQEEQEKAGNDAQKYLVGQLQQMLSLMKIQYADLRSRNDALQAKVVDIANRLDSLAGGETEEEEEGEEGEEEHMQERQEEVRDREKEEREEMGVEKKGGS